MEAHNKDKLISYEIFVINTLREESLALVDINSRLTLNKLTNIFPPKFFDVMEYLLIHLV